MTMSEMARPIVPKEHGAWAVLYGAFLAGVGVAGRLTHPVALLLVAVTAAGLANGPLGMLLRPAAGREQGRRRQRALSWLLVYAAAGTAALTALVLVHGMTFLLPFGMAAAGFLVWRAFLLRARDDRTLTGELVGVAGLSMVGAAAHAVAVGEVRPISSVLWLLLFLFFASGVFYVRMRVQRMIAERKAAPVAGNPALWPCIAYHALLLVLLPGLLLGRVVPWPVLLAFAPALWRAATGLRKVEARLDLKRLGWSEVAVAATFVLLLIAAFRLAPLAG